MEKSITGAFAANMLNLKKLKQAIEVVSVNNNMGEFPHYREKLLRQDLGAYDRLKEGILSFHKKIDMPTGGNHKYENKFKYVLLDTPMIFHVDGCNVLSVGKDFSILPKYVVSAGSYKHYKEECMSKVGRTARQ